MTNITYLNLDEILAIHYSEIKTFGGIHGVRDLDLLISAISRPQTTFGGLDLYPNIFNKASALIQSLILNHAFLDGNKRTALVSTVRFLYINGYSLVFSKKNVVEFPLKINSKKLTSEKISHWLKLHSTKLSL